jgi:hypothetical protein
LTAQSLAETKYRYNVNPAFSGENIPPFQLLGQKAGLVAGHVAIGGLMAVLRLIASKMYFRSWRKIVQLSFMAAPETLILVYSSLYGWRNPPNQYNQKRAFSCKLLWGEFTFQILSYNKALGTTT